MRNRWSETRSAKLRWERNQLVRQFGLSFWKVEWMNELMTEWTHDWMNSRLNELMTAWTHEWMNSWLNELMNEWTYDLFNGLMNEWMKSLINKLMNEWNNEWMNSLFFTAATIQNLTCLVHRPRRNWLWLALEIPSEHRFCLERSLINNYEISIRSN